MINDNIPCEITHVFLVFDIDKHANLKRIKPDQVVKDT